MIRPCVIRFRVIRLVRFVSCDSSREIRLVKFSAIGRTSFIGRPSLLFVIPTLNRDPSPMFVILALSRDLAHSVVVGNWHWWAMDPEFYEGISAIDQIVC